jgi:LPS-assembly protein
VEKLPVGGTVGGWRQTAWVMDRREDDSLDRSNYRQIVDARLDLSTEFSKIMGSPVAAVERIRHSARPRVIYEYIPDQDQSDLPFFTDLDRIDQKNIVTYSLTNTFTARTTKGVRPTATFGDGALSARKTWSAGSMQVDAASPTTFDYNRFCRFFLQQSYDIAAARDDQPEPFSDIFGELDFNFGRYVSVDSDASYNPYDNNISSHNIGAAIADRRGDRLWMEHSYTKDNNESINAALSVKLSHRLIARGEYERNLQTDKDISKGVGFLYTAQCWSVDFFYGMEGEDNKFLFSINLMGIGGFGE